MTEEEGTPIDLGPAIYTGSGKAKVPGPAGFEIKTLDWNGNEISEKPVKIARPPATHLVSVLKFVLTHTAFHRMVAAYVSQEQHAYYEALQQRDLRHARWIEIRMYLLLTWITCRAFISPVIRLITRPG